MLLKVRNSVKRKIYKPFCLSNYGTMKRLNITFEDKNFLILEKAKEKHSGNWHDFIIDVVRYYLHQTKIAEKSNK